MSRDPGDGEGQGNGKRRRARRPRPSPSQLSPDEAREKATATALRLLALRERSRRELWSALRRKGYAPDTIEAVLDGLEGSGLQSDRRFAEAFTVSAHAGRGLSTTATQGELRRRGVDAGLAAEAAREHPDVEEARARELARGRARRMGAGPIEARRRRLLGFLARRGYGGDLARRMVAEVLGEQADEPAPAAPEDDLRLPGQAGDS